MGGPKIPLPDSPSHCEGRAFDPVVHISRVFGPQTLIICLFMPNTGELCAIVLAGGRGTRFWPRSRRLRAKQLLNIVGTGTMLQQTLQRLRPLVTPQNTWVITSRELRSAVLTQAPEIPPAQVIAEPEGRNTAPAIGLGAELVLRARGDVPLGVFPSDHLIGNPEKFAAVIHAATTEARRPGRIVVMGISPSRPETGYGYIETIEEPTRRKEGSPLRVRKFVEKPDLAHAKQYKEAGNYYWNSGMFLWRASTILEALAEFLPGTSERLRKIAEAPKSKFAAALAHWYPACDNISIDHGVLEKARGIVCIPAPGLDWNDLGSWAAVYEQLAPRGGTVSQAGEVVEYESGNNFIHVEGKTVGLVGVKDMIVVETADALLIVPRSQAQNVGKLVQELEKRALEKLL